MGQCTSVATAPATATASTTAAAPATAATAPTSLHYLNNKRTLERKILAINKLLANLSEGQERTNLLTELNTLNEEFTRVTSSMDSCQRQEDQKIFDRYCDHIMTSILTGKEFTNHDWLAIHVLKNSITRLQRQAIFDNETAKKMNRCLGVVSLVMDIHAEDGLATAQTYRVAANAYLRDYDEDNQ